MIRTLAFLIISLFCIPLVAQSNGPPIGSIDYKEVYSYKNWYESEKEAGYVYFLVTAEWCAPCQVLLKHLKEANMEHMVVYVDFDKENRVSKYLTKNAGIPFLVRYEIYFKPGEKTISLRGRTVCTDRRYLDFIRGK